MSGFKKLLLCLLLGTSIYFPLYAENEKTSSIYYLKLGAIFTPCESIVLPSCGLGARFQKNSFGFDLSANISTLLFVNYASLKGTALFFPFPQKKHQFYLGFGSGCGHFRNSVPMGQPFRGANRNYGHLTLEGIVGYEFRHATYFKTFIQLELSQPIYCLSGKRRSQDYQPNVALLAGFGF